MENPLHQQVKIKACLDHYRTEIFGCMTMEVMAVLGEMLACLDLAAMVELVELVDLVDLVDLVAMAVVAGFLAVVAMVELAELAAWLVSDI